MPKYFYKCLREECSEVMEIVHSMSTTIDACLFCTGSVERVPFNTINILKPTDSTAKQKTGSVVKKSIEAFREDLKEEKRRLKKVEYKP